MSTPELAIQIQHLDQRLAQVEASLRRVEQLLINLQDSQAGESAALQTRLPRTIRLASPRLRQRGQSADFVMVVTRDAFDAGV